MSWSLSISSVKASEVSEKLEEAFDKLPASAVEDAAVQDQFDAAASAISSIMHSGAVGEPDQRSNSSKLFNVSISAHANPDHEPTSGMANDSITVTVTQAS